jgi:hypothetical protein
MNQYRVKFYYGTDLRCDYVVTAHNDLAALAKALDCSALETWCGDPAMRVEIAFA